MKTDFQSASLTGRWAFLCGLWTDIYCCRTIMVFILWAPSLTRRQVCNLLVQFVVTLGFKSRSTRDLNLQSRLRLPQPGRPSPCIYIPRDRVALLYPFLMAVSPYFMASKWSAKGTSNPTVTPLLRSTKPLPSNSYFSCFTVLPMRKYASILTELHTNPLRYCQKVTRWTLACVSSGQVIWYVVFTAQNSLT
jgi:hypothetical protein